MAKTFAERYPGMQEAYNQLNATQKKILDEFGDLELKQLKDFKQTAVAKILAVYVIPAYSTTLSKNQLKTKAKNVYTLAKTTLEHSNCTTNVPASLIALKTFRDSDELATVWTTKTTKGEAYFLQRQNVEENAFGYKLEWGVSLEKVARQRPVYAALNYTDHPYGGASGYGHINCVLKPEVKMRSTFLHRDTFEVFQQGNFKTGRKQICTAAHLENLTANLSDDRLKALCEKAEGRYVLTDLTPAYIEAEIHGGIRFDRDIVEIKIDELGLDDTRRLVLNPSPSALEMRNWIIGFATKCKAPAAFYRNRAATEVLYTPPIIV